MSLKHTLFFAVFFMLCLNSQAFAMTLDEFLEETKQSNNYIISLQDQIEAAKEEEKTKNLSNPTELFAEASYARDEKEGSITSSYDELENRQYKVGVSHQSDFGLNTTLSYNVNHFDYINPVFLNPPGNIDYYLASPVVEVSMPIWGKNRFGLINKSQEEVIEKSAIAKQHSFKSLLKKNLVSAETAYWNVIISQEQVNILEKIVDQAKSIFEINDKKNKMRLTDKSDVLQAQALYETKKLELENAQNQFRKSKQEFNKWLNRPIDQELPELSALDLVNLPLNSTEKGKTDDLKSLEAETAANKANQKIEENKVASSLSVFGSYASFGEDDVLSKSNSDAFGLERESMVVGMKLSIPLNVIASNNASEAAKRRYKAAEENLQQSNADEEKNFTMLVQEIENLSKRYKSMIDLESVQLDKMQNEASLYRKGRTSTLQVLTFTEDYLSTRLERINMAYQLLILNSQLKLYVEDEA